MQQKDPVQADLVWQRKVRNGRYIYEDYLEAIQKTKVIGYTYLLIGIIYLGSTLAFGESLPHTLITLLMGLSLLFVHHLYGYDRKGIAILVAAVYVSLVFVEYILFGLPDLLVPDLEDSIIFEMVDAITIISLANAISPLLYFALKVALLYPLFVIIYQERKVKTIPRSIQKKIGVPMD